MEMNATIRIGDLGLAAALVSADHPILETEKDGYRRILFVFRDSDGLQDDIRKYWANTLSVPARLYFDNTKMLKSRIYGDN